MKGKHDYKQYKKRIVVRDIAGNIFERGFAFGEYGVIRRDPWGQRRSNLWILIHVRTGVYGDVAFKNLEQAKTYCEWKEEQDKQSGNYTGGCSRGRKRKVSPPPPENVNDGPVREDEAPSDVAADSKIRNGRESYFGSDAVRLR